MDRLKIRKVKADQTVSYQLGRYEMADVYNPRVSDFRRRSVFKMEVHLGEYPTVEEALSEWPRQIARLREIGRERKAQTLESKLERLQELTSEAREEQDDG